MPEFDLSTWVMRDGTELAFGPAKPALDQWVIKTKDGQVSLISYQDALNNNSPLIPPPEEWVYAEVEDSGLIGLQQIGNPDGLTGRVMRWYIHDPLWRQSVSGFDITGAGSQG